MVKQINNSLYYACQNKSLILFAKISTIDFCPKYACGYAEYLFTSSNDFQKKQKLSKVNLELLYFLPLFL